MAEESSCPFKAVRHADSTSPHDAWDLLIRDETSLTLETNTKHRIELEFDVHSTAFLKITAKRPQGPGATVRFTYSEAYEVLPRPGQGQGFTNKDDRTKRQGHSLVGPSDRYTFGGIAASNEPLESYEPFWWKTFRFIVIEIEVKDEPLTLEKLVFTQTNYPLNVVADWRATEETEKMWEISIRTMRNCMFDGYSDCPFYEQLQWVGFTDLLYLSRQLMLGRYGEDSRSAMLFHYLLSGDDRLGRQAITAFAASSQPDGLLLARYPAHTKHVIVGFPLFWIMEVCDHMLYFNDPEFATQFLPVIDSVFGFFERLTNPKTGLVSNLPRWFWAFIDWNIQWGFSEGFSDNGMPMEGRKTGTWSFFTMIYAFTLRRVCVLLQQLGRTDKVSDYARRADAATIAVKKYCYDGSLFSPTALSRCVMPAIHCPRYHRYGACCVTLWIRKVKTPSVSCSKLSSRTPLSPLPRTRCNITPSVRWQRRACTTTFMMPRGRSGESN